MLWSVCTSTFIPFLSVFVATGNSACPLAGIAHNKQTTTTINTALRNSLIAFISPHANPFSKTYKSSKMFTMLRVGAQHAAPQLGKLLNAERKFQFALTCPILKNPLLPHCEHAHRAARTALQLDRRHHQKSSCFRQLAQIRQI